MKEFVISGMIPISCLTFVKASSKEEALEIVKNRSVQRVELSSSGDNEWVVSTKKHKEIIDIEIEEFMSPHDD